MSAKKQSLYTAAFEVSPRFSFIGPIQESGSTRLPLGAQVQRVYTTFLNEIYATICPLREFLIIVLRVLCIGTYTIKLKDTTPAQLSILDPL